VKPHAAGRSPARTRQLTSQASENVAHVIHRRTFVNDVRPRDVGGTRQFCDRRGCAPVSDDGHVKPESSPYSWASSCPLRQFTPCAAGVTVSPRAQASCRPAHASVVAIRGPKQDLP
jgi:hypothetical protein